MSSVTLNAQALKSRNDSDWLSMFLSFIIFCAVTVVGVVLSASQVKSALLSILPHVQHIHTEN